MQVRLAWQQLPQLAGVAIAHRGKMGVMVTQFWQEAVFSVFRGRDSGQNSQPMRPRTVLNSARSLRLDPFPAEWKAVSPGRFQMSDGVVGIPNALEIYKRSYSDSKTLRNNCLVSSIALLRVVLE